MHEEARLLYNIRQVDASQREVREGAHKVPILEVVSDWRVIGCRQLVLSVNRVRLAVTLSQASTLE